ncbi:MAG: ROK family protein [Candidatus Omnitrophica bacterium]|nr:ROK family protein [Candidatus Omnitrophota bacterium]
MRLCTIGIDVGGTNIKLGLVAPSGRIIARTNLITKSYARHPRHLINALVSAVRDLIRDNGKTAKDIAGIGIGLPGLIDVPQGIVIFMPNIPGWKNIPLRRIMERQLKIPVFLDNDVNVITLGEWKSGAGKGCANLVCITLGTGVGGGLILNNALYRGEGFVAGEIGHLPLNEDGPSCNCGGYACFERYVGNRILMQKAAQLFRDTSVRLPDVFARARRGDRRAIRFWQDAATHIGNALVGVINLLNPRMIIIGGGVANNFRFMGPTIRKVIRQRALKVQKKMVRVVRAELGDDAGILGAHILVKEAILGRKII